MIELHSVDPIITALGWMLVHFLWQGLVLGAVYALLIGCMRDAPAVTRYWVGMGTLAAMLLSAIVTFAFVYQAPAVSSSGLAISMGAISTNAVSLEVSAWDAFVIQLEILLPWAVLAWLSGVFLLSGRIAIDFWRIRKLAIEGVRPLPEPWPTLVKRLCRSLGLPRLVSVVESTKVSVPMVVGWLKPVILIPPSALMGLTHKQLELIISHELAHVKRLDYLFNILQLVVETLLYYHPMVRYIATQVRVERENCCDDMVVAGNGDTLAYAHALTEVEGLRCSSGMQIVLAATGGNLVGRVRRLAGMPAPQRGAIQWIAALMLVGASATAFTGARFAADAGIDVAPEPPEAVSAPVLVRNTANVSESEIIPQAAAIETRAPIISRIEMPLAEPKNVATQEADASAEVEPAQPAAILAAVTAPSAKDIPAVDSAPLPESHSASPLASEAAPEPIAAPAVIQQDKESANTSDYLPLEPVLEEAPAPEAPQPIMGGGTVKTPVGPKYPRQAKMRGIEGFVKVGYTVSSDGRVEGVEILDAVPTQLFESTVVKALRKWRYEPFTVDGVPTAQSVTQVFEFNVERAELDEAEKSGRCRRGTGSRLCRDSMDPGITGVSVVYNTL